jgi:glucan phosphoethanolaminetransferase (alkaline phosphatase superfamily)
MRNYKYWLRWLAVLPGACGAVIVTYWCLHVVLSTVYLPSNLEVIDFIGVELAWLEALRGFVVFSVFVYVGSRIAPTYKRAVSIVLFCLQVLFLGGMAFRLLSDPWMTGHKLLEFAGMLLLAPFAGAVTGLYLAIRRIKKQSVLALSKGGSQSTQSTTQP